MKALSKTAGLSDTFVFDMLKRNREPSIGNFVALAETLGVSLNWLLYGSDDGMTETPVSGIVGAGQEVTPFDDMVGDEHASTALLPAHYGKVTVVEIRGDSMYPKYENGDLIAYGVRAPNIRDAEGRECVVRLADGRMYLKKVYRGTQPRTARLISHNAPPLDDVEIEWAAPLIGWIRRARDNA